MERESDSDDLLTRYLLGELSHQEQERIEEGYFGDRGFYEHLLVVEDGLIDAYVSNQLPAARRERFEKFFLASPERRERVRFAEAWLTFIGEAARRRGAARPLPVAGFARFKRPAILLPLAAGLLVALGGVWLLFETAQLSSELQQARAASEQLKSRERDLEQQVSEERERNEKLALQIEQERAAREQTEVPSRPPPSEVVSLVLSSGLVRGQGNAKRLVLPPEAKIVRLEFSFRADGYASYSAAIRTAEGREIWSQDGLKPLTRATGKVIVLRLPTRLFSEADYILTLSGITSDGNIETINQYSFTVVK